MPSLTPDSIARLMADFRRGNNDAAKQLFELSQPELRRLAAAKMTRERVDHTWQPTALVNELYFELIKVKALREGSGDGNSEKTEFLRLAGYLMKQLLIQHSRPLYRQAEKVEPAEDVSAYREESLHEVEDALSSLAEMDPNLRSVVELKVFEGLSGEEIAEGLGLSLRTVARYWNFAKRWLQETWLPESASSEPGS